MSFKHKNKIKVSSPKLLICADEERLGARNSPVVMPQRSNALSHPKADSSPTSWPTPEARMDLVSKPFTSRNIQTLLLTAVRKHGARCNG